MVYKIPNKLLRYGNFMVLDYLIINIDYYWILSIVEQLIKKCKLKIKTSKELRDLYWRYNREY